MSLYLRNIKSYEELIMSGLLCLPDPMRLRRISDDIKVGEGGDPMIYSFQKEVQERNSDRNKNCIGHLILDQIKLKNRISSNTNSNEVTGFLPEHNVYQ